MGCHQVMLSLLGSFQHIWYSFYLLGKLNVLVMVNKKVINEPEKYFHTKQQSDYFFFRNGKSVIFIKYRQNLLLNLQVQIVYFFILQVN